MKLNEIKTKEMVISFRRSEAILVPILVEDHQIERVSFFKLLGVYVTDDLGWALHVEKITKKASSCLYFLKQLKRAGLSPSDLSTFYVTIIRPI